VIAGIYAVLILAPLFITGLLLARFGGMKRDGTIFFRYAIAVLGFVGVPFLAAVLFPSYGGSPPPPPPTVHMGLVCVPICILFVKRLPLGLAAAVLFALPQVFFEPLWEWAMYSPGQRS